MVKQVPYIEPNQWYHRVVNRISYWYLLLLNKKKVEAQEPISSPVFVTGFFRSGTSLVTHLLQECGMNVGPDNDLLKSKGSRADLNRDGFFENYLFMDASLYAFNKLTAWGHLPPSTEEVMKVDLTESEEKLFQEFSLCGVHDDRISNRNKIHVLKHYGIGNLNLYLLNEFGDRPLVKNPHFSVLWPWLIRKWPKSKFIVCFRNPTAAIASASKITPQLTDKVYLRYYESILKMDSSSTVFISYDHLMQHPELTIHRLINILDLKVDHPDRILSLIKKSEYRFKEDEIENGKLKELYLQLLSKASNIP